ncbi:MAG: hypothetical protein AAF654_00940 [Myxococcota bacterium]
MRTLTLFISLLIASCGGGTASKPKVSGQTPPAPSEPLSVKVDDWLRETVPDPVPTGWIYGTGVAASAEDAKRLATIEMREKFWGDSQWPMLAPEVAMFDISPPDLFSAATVEAHESGDDYAVVASMEVQSIGQIVDAALEGHGPTLDAYRSNRDGIASLVPSLHVLWAAEAKVRVCDRLRALTETEATCEDETATRDGALIAVTRLMDGLVLEPRFDGGVPVGPDGRPSRPLEVLVTWTDGTSDAAPAPRVPLKVTDGKEWIGQQEAASGPDGIASLDFGEVLPNPETRIGLELYAEAWAGDLGPLLPELALSIPFRRVTPSTARVGLLIQEVSVDQDTTFLASALQSGLAEARGGDVQLVDETLASIVGTLNPDTLRQLADASRGRIDVLVAGRATSSLASRMGSRSVYHEASATLTLYDVWTGAEITTVERSTQALGLGDARAAKNALRQLGGELVEFVNVALKRPVALGPR